MKTFKVNLLISILLITVSLVLMIFKIYQDSEPGAIPILLLILGTGWFFITRPHH